MIKSTYGTGCFAVVNTGNHIVISQHKLLSTLAWRIDGIATYALEGSIFMAGATVQWLRDELGIIATAAETECLAQGIDYQQTELLIPAFTGLGAPYWQPKVQAALFGMSRNTGRRQLAAAALRSVAYQSRDLLQAIEQENLNVEQLRVDGGMTENRWFLQALADLTGKTITPCQTTDATALGAAFLVALQLGWYNDISAIARLWHSDLQYNPMLSNAEASRLHQRWQQLVAALISVQ